MKRFARLVLGLAATIAACSPTAAPDPASRLFEISEVGLGPQGYVTLRNFTDRPANLGGLFLCQEEGCVGLPAAVVQAGQIARIAVSDGRGLADVVMSGAELRLEPSSGEVALFASQSLENVTDLRAYLEWGTTPHALTGVAIEAGLWQAATYAPSDPGATRLWKNEDNLWVFDPAEQ